MVKNIKVNIPKILIAEDDISNYMLFEFILKHDYTLFHANNGHEAVQLFKNYSPELILMDIRMPEMDGYEATALIRSLSTTVPVIAVTACAFSEDEQRIMSSGFNAYITKPITIKELTEKITEFLHL